MAAKDVSAVDEPSTNICDPDQSLLQENFVGSIYESPIPNSEDTQMFEQNLVESNSHLSEQILNSEIVLKNQLHSVSLENEMCNSGDSHSEIAMKSTAGRLSLENLPSLVLLRIFYYISCKDLVRNVSLTCQRLFRLIDDSVVWKRRLSEEYSKAYPLVPLDEETFNDVHYWQKAAVSQEVTAKMWRDGNYEWNIYKDEHFAEIDSVWLSWDTRYAYSGGRDRQIIQWGLKENKFCRKFLGHAGWVWSLRGLNDEDRTLVSGSWDKTVKFWDTEKAECFLTHKLESAVLSLTQFGNNEKRDVVYYSLYNRFIGCFDSRSPVETKKIISQSDHRKAVLCLETYNDYYLFSGSEDSTIKCFDIRTDRMVNQVRLKSIVLSLSCNDGILLASSKEGKIFCLDPKIESENGCYLWGEKVHGNNVTCVQYHNGAIISGSSDKTVKISEPCIGGSVIRTLTDHKMTVCDVMYRKGVLVTASSDQTLIAYLPTNVIEED